MPGKKGPSRRSPDKTAAEDRLLRLFFALQNGTVLGREDREWLVGFLGQLIFDPGHPARKHLNLKVRRGRPRDELKPIRLKTYFMLARLVGHNAATAIELARNTFGYEDARSVEQVLGRIKNTTISNPNAKTHEDKVVWLTAMLEIDGISPPPAPMSAMVRASRSRRRKP